MTTLEKWVAAAVLVTGGAAAIQATAAILIKRLTKRLADTTDRYALETKRMADEMARQEELHAGQVSKNAARTLLAEILESQHHFGRLSLELSKLDQEERNNEAMEGYRLFTKGHLLNHPLIVDAELRDRLDRGFAVASGLITMVWEPTSDKDLAASAWRAMQGLKGLRYDLACHVRGEALGPHTLPHAQRAVHWLMAGQDAKLSDFLEDS